MRLTRHLKSVTRQLFRGIVKHPLRSIFHAVLALGIMVLARSVAAEDMTWTVMRLWFDGKETTEIKQVLRRNRASEDFARVNVKPGEHLQAGVELAVPSRVSIELKDSNGNQTTLYPGARIVLMHLTTRGARQQLIEGRAKFSISKALDYFNVYTAEGFLAAVKGTEYELSINPGTSLEFTVLEGTVQVERTGTVLIAKGKSEAPETIQNIRQLELLNAGKVRRYDLTQEEYLREFGNFQEAEAYFRDSLLQAEKSGDLDLIQSARAHLGIILLTLSQPDEAMALFQRNLETAKDNDDPLNHANALAGIGAAHYNLSEYLLAINYHEQSLSMRKRLFGERDHDSIASSLNNIGLAYDRLSDYSRALEYHEQSLAMKKRLFGERDHDLIASSLNNNGMAYYRLSDYIRALEYYEQSLEMRKRLFGERDHNSIASSLNNIGLVYHGLSDYLRALE